MTHHDPKLVTRDEAVKMLTKARKAFEKYRDTYSTTYIGNMDHYISEALKALQSPPAREEFKQVYHGQWNDSFESFHAEWVSRNGSRSPSVKEAMRWMYDMMKSSPPQSQDDREDGSQRVSLYMDILAKKAPGEDAMQELLCKPLVLMELGWQSARAAQSEDVDQHAAEHLRKVLLWAESMYGRWVRSTPSHELTNWTVINDARKYLEAIKAAEGDVSKNRQNLNISERHNEKSDDSQYVSVPKDAFNELIRLVKYEAVVALEQSRMSVSLVEDIRNAIKAAEGENGC